MNRRMKKIAVVALAAMGIAAFADTPSITLRRFQQRYPWNNLIDIDYTVANVDNPEDYYVRFTVMTNGAATGILARSFLNDTTLAMASNGSYRVTWDTKRDQAFIFSKNVSVKADLMFDSGCKGNRSPYAIEFLVIDLTKGTSATANDPYPVTYEYFYDKETAKTHYNTDEYKTNKLVLRRIKAGTFTMGSPETETGRQRETWMNKETQHTVTLTKDYFIGVFPVTQTQWQKVMGGANPSYFKGNTDAATCPVEQVSYQMIRGATKGCAVPITGEVDAGSFLALLRGKTGLTDLDLPTEAQWEYATRAGTTGSTYFGNNVATDTTLLKAHIWYKDNSASMTHGVGQFPSNPWGLYDTIGNVWEWCRDRVTVAPNHDLGSAAATDPLSEVSNGNVTGRGGSCYHDGTASRSACRTGDLAVSTTIQSFGFRLSRTLP